MLDGVLTGYQTKHALQGCCQSVEESRFLRMLNGSINTATVMWARLHGLLVFSLEAVGEFSRECNAAASSGKVHGYR